ncbi:hypothetical protein APR41_14970 [Salegentibacter salinarum]|uniref:Uncharacterized protein n=1 Tax=Salegentibacter salinarum TaxID=447422 RepID=A0A2N0TZ00_9FLAO|nr:hypothetical protein APR41_14970 [Salegentibacter salinarum]
MAIFIAVWKKLFFRKRDIHLFEILVLLCFFMGMGMIVNTVFGFVDSLIDFNQSAYTAIMGFKTNKYI